MSSAKPAIRAEQYIDFADEHEGHWFVRTATIVSKQTKYQKIEVLEFTDFGKALLLDGALQSVEDDEYIYHEALVQPAMCLHPDPRRVLIVGGGEGASAREALSHPTVEEVVMVDIDEEVVELCRRHLTVWHQGAFDDPRFRLVIGDGGRFIRESADAFDVIVIDVVDSFDGGPAEALYSTEFYQCVKKRLRAGAVLAIQGMECDVNEWEDHRCIRDNLKPVFAHVRSAMAFVPSFWSTWGFILASDQVDPLGVPPASIDRVIEKRGLAQRLEFYDGRTHVGMFNLAKDLRKLFGESG
jgi:spermidine synthase